MSAYMAFEHRPDAGGIDPPHSHSRAQLSLSLTGVTTVTVEGTSYVLPPHRAIWIPAHRNHHSKFGKDARYQSVMLDPIDDTGLTQCRVFETTALVRALIGEIAHWPDSSDDECRRTVIADLLIGEIRRSPALPSTVPLPRDARLRRVCEAVIADPSDSRTIEDWARHLHMSRRAFTRLCRENLGIGFAAWRRRVRMTYAIARISSGEAIACVAYDIGYESPGAFASLFRKTFGDTASNYCRR